LHRPGLPSVLAHTSSACVALSHAKNVTWTERATSLSLQSLYATYYSTDNLQRNSSVAALVEGLEWDYASMDGLTRLNQSLPDPGAGFSVRWAGFFTPPQAAAYTFSFVLGESLDLDFNNELVTSVNERVKVRLMPAHLPVANPPSIAKRGAR
jgi:hypothetical protein